MDQQTISIANRMLLIINDFEACKLSLRRLVDSLEGSINAMEEKLPPRFIELWYESWGNLEIILGDSNGFLSDYPEDIKEPIEQIKKLIKEHLLQSE